MKEEFLTFEAYNNKESALELAKTLDENKIDYIIDDASSSLDSGFGNYLYNKEFRVRIKKQDFEEVDKILQKLNDKEIAEVGNDYYLLSFSDDELIDVISKRDEWNQFDFLLALKLLKERGKEITPEDVDKIKQNRIQELSKPEEGQKEYIIVGYILSFFGGFLGFFIGWHLLSYKKTLPNGEKIYAYSKDDRKHGNRILIISLIFFIIWVSFRILI